MSSGLAKHELTFLRSVSETKDIKSFYFSFSDNLFTYKPGQVLKILLEPFGTDSLSREFSIASSPTENYLLFTMRMLTGSEFKSRINSLSAGEKILGEGPHGDFTLPDETSHPLIFIAGGIGVTPYRGMLKYIADNSLPYKVTLLYSARTPEEILYKKDWDEFCDKILDFKAIFTITRPEGASSHWRGRVGRIDESLIYEHISDIRRTIFYICGTPDMVRSMMKLLFGMGISPQDIKVESFSGYKGEDT